MQVSHSSGNYTAGNRSYIPESTEMSIQPSTVSIINTIQCDRLDLDSTPLDSTLTANMVLQLKVDKQLV